jgi:hypothetical protein
MPRSWSSKHVERELTNDDGQLLAAADVSVSKSNGVVRVRRRNGSLLYWGTAGLASDDLAIAKAIDAAPNAGMVLVREGTYDVGRNLAGFKIEKDLTIRGGSKQLTRLRYAEVDRYDDILFDVGPGRNVTLAGLTIDQNKHIGMAAGGTATSASLYETLRLVNCDVVNAYKRSVGGFISVRNPYGQTLAIRIEDSFFDVGSSRSEMEFLVTNAVASMRIERSRFVGCELGVVSARDSTLRDIRAERAPVAGNAKGFAIQSVRTRLDNVVLQGLDMTLRPYCAVHPSENTLWANAKRIEVVDLTILDRTSPLLVQGFQNVGFEEVVLRNVHLTHGGVLVEPEPSQNRQSSFLQVLDIDGLRIDALERPSAAVVIRDVRVGTLRLRNLQLPTGAERYRIVGSGSVAEVVNT